MKYLNWSKKIIKKAVEIFLYKYSDGFLYIIAYLLYYLSLESCLKGEELCGNNMAWIKTSYNTFNCNFFIICYL